MFLSMIIPVYNTEKYLAECLDSCLSQDLPYDDYEIICINDGSKDGSLDILRSYEARYPNIIVIDQPNGGVSAARNAGLDAARGEFVWFIDADDLIRSHVLKLLMSALEEHGCDRLSFNNLYFFTETLSAQEKKQLAEGTLHSNGTHGDGEVWSSLYRRSLLTAHHVRYHEGVAYGEDLLFMYEWNLIPHKKASISDLIYLQRRNSGSAIANSRSRRSVDSDYLGASTMKPYFLKECAGGTPRTETCFIFSHFVKCAMLTLAYADRATWNRGRRRFADAGLFPIRMPRSYKPYRTPNMDKQNIFMRTQNYFYQISYTTYGAWMLRFFCQTRQTLIKLLRK